MNTYAAGNFETEVNGGDKSGIFRGRKNFRRIPLPSAPTPKRQSNVLARWQHHGTYNRCAVAAIKAAVCAQSLDFAIRYPAAADGTRSCPR